MCNLFLWLNCTPESALSLRKLPCPRGPLPPSTACIKWLVRRGGRRSYAKEHCLQKALPVTGDLRKVERPSGHLTMTGLFKQTPNTDEESVLSWPWQIALSNYSSFLLNWDVASETFSVQNPRCPPPINQHWLDVIYGICQLAPERVYKVYSSLLILGSNRNNESIESLLEWIIEY